MKTHALIGALAFASLLHGCVSTSVGDRPVSDEEAAVANLNLGAAYLQQGRPEVALESLQRALRQNPRLADAHSTIALAYDQLDEPEQAEEHYRRAVQLQPSNGAAQNSYAVFLCRQNRWDDAEEFFERAAESSRYATPWIALSNAGTCARGASDTVKAAQYFRAALEENDRFPDALRAMMELSYQEANYLQARAFMQRLFAVQPPDARSLWLCFHIEQNLDDEAAAERCAEQLDEGFPLSPELAQIRGSSNNAGQ